jgi:hypothetical protein
VSVSAVLYPRWLLLLKIEISSNGQNCSILSQNVPKFELLKHDEFHPPFFLICKIGQNRQKFKVHKKSCNICLKAHHYALAVQIWAHSGLK